MRHQLAPLPGRPETTAIKTNLTRIAAAIAALAATLTVGLATPPSSHAIDRTGTSAYFCSSPSTQWLTYGGMAGYKCFQYWHTGRVLTRYSPVATHGHSAGSRCSLRLPAVVRAGSLTPLVVPGCDSETPVMSAMRLAQL